MINNLPKAGEEGYFYQLLLKYGPIVKVMAMGEFAVPVYNSVDATPSLVSMDICAEMI